MTHFLRMANRYEVAPEEAFDVWDTLPANTFSVKQNPLSGQFYLETVDDYSTTAKLYGNISKTRDRIFNTFNERESGTGVLLGGEKGSGKTLLAKLLSEQARLANMPTLIINDSLFGEEFNQFIQRITQPAVIIFDEFEKIYDRSEQEQMLTLLDGVYPTKKLFILTVNDSYGINQHMINRPGRIYYRLTYEGLDKDFIQEYCDDTMFNKEHVDAVVKLSALYGAFNFDMLKALVEECNRYNEHPLDAVKILNAKPEHSDEAEFFIEAYRNGAALDLTKGDRWGEVSLDELSDPAKPATWEGNPLSGGTFASFYQDSNERWRARHHEFRSHEFAGTDERGRLVFETEDGISVYLTRQPRYSYSYGAY